MFFFGVLWIHFDVVICSVAPTLLMEDASGVRHDTYTCDYIQLSHFFKFLVVLMSVFAVDVSVSCVVFVLVLHRSYVCSDVTFWNLHRFHLFVCSFPCFNLIHSSTRESY